jgi:conjugal transfer pilus assembly protein TraA
MKFKEMVKSFGVLSALALASNSASAATTGSEFTAMATKVQGWVEGGLGLVISLVALALGLGMSLARSNVMPAIFAIVIALVATVGPGIIVGLFTMPI